MKTILVVDDSAVDRRLVGGLLERNTEWHIAYSPHGKAAQERIQETPPDLIITDLMMPEMNGLELVAAVKKQYPFIPIILMTAKGSEEIAVRALEQGAASYVPKSRLAEEMRETVEQVLAAAGKHRTIARLVDHVTQTKRSFVLENDTTLISALVNFLQQDLTRIKLCDDAERLRVGIALEAALLSAIIHGNLELAAEQQGSSEETFQQLVKQRASKSPFKDRRVHLTATVTRDEAVYVIRDDRSEEAQVARSSLGADLDLDEPTARELLLMRTLMDEVSFNELGNEVRMVKHRPSSE